MDCVSLPVQLKPFMTPSNTPLVVFSNKSSWVEFSPNTWSKTNLRSLLALLLMFLFRPLWEPKQDMSSSFGSNTNMCLSTTWTTLRIFSFFSFSLVGLTRTTTFTWLHTLLSIVFPHTVTKAFLQRGGESIETTMMVCILKLLSFSNTYWWEQWEKLELAFCWMKGGKAGDGCNVLNISRYDQRFECPLSSSWNFLEKDS